jgi:Chaperone of endosialidase
MNSLIQLNKTTSLFCIALLLACFGPSPGVQATDLDGVLPGGNNADGFGVLTNLTTGEFNTGAGWFSLFSDQSGSFNTAFGAATLLRNTAGANTATGAAALFSNTTGNSNTATGAFALFSNDTGSSNTAIGSSALGSNTTGSSNTATGVGALGANTIGGFNTANGIEALTRNTTGGSNTAMGYVALSSLTTGGGNTAVGDAALDFLMTGDNNTAMGLGALEETMGSNNTALGIAAGQHQINGNNNIYIGDFGGSDESNTIAIGNLASSGTNYTKFYVGAVYGVTTLSGITLPVIVSDGGQLGTAPSAARFKKEIKPMDKVSESILALKPVTFHYKSDTKGTPQFGLVAEEVAAVNPDLVVRDKNGEIYSVRYDAVNAMLLNEFLKAHRKIEDQEATITELKSTAAQQEKDFQATVAHQQKQIDALGAGLEKVNAKLELTKQAPQMVLNNR